MQREKNDTSDRSDPARVSNALVIIEPPLGVSGAWRHKAMACCPNRHLTCFRCERNGVYILNERIEVGAGKENIINRDKYSLVTRSVTRDLFMDVHHCHQAGYHGDGVAPNV